MPTEVAAITGAVVRAAAAASPPVPTPLNSLLLSVVGALGGDGPFAARAKAAREALGVAIAREGSGLAAEVVAAGAAALEESTAHTIV